MPVIEPSSDDRDAQIMRSWNADLRRIAELEAGVERLREALNIALYHIDNLNRVRDGQVVRDLDESTEAVRCRARPVLDKARDVK